jgi:hypothetical protein
METERKTDLLSRLADLSEDAIQRLNSAPGGDRVLGAFNALRERMDELQKRVRGLEDLDKRLTALEGKVDKLAKGGSSATASGGKPAPTTKSSGGTRAKKSEGTE